jgi:hypothetical protein
MKRMNRAHSDLILQRPMCYVCTYSIQAYIIVNKDDLVLKSILAESQEGTRNINITGTHTTSTYSERSARIAVQGFKIREYIYIVRTNALQCKFAKPIRL